MEESLRKLAKELLESKRVGVVIGYGQGVLESKVTPIFVTAPEEADKLIFNDHCYHNLSRYLRKAEVKSLGKAAVVAKGCDVRAIVNLIVENQLKREDIYIIGVTCRGQVDDKKQLLSKCHGCEVQTPKNCDIVLESKEVPRAESAESLDEEIARLDAMTPEERWAFWKSEFDRCIRCYACRQICPMCFCQSCVSEKTTPQWISTSSSSAGNFSWNVFRAFHLAGRCTGCLECARACPVGIRLDLINRKLALEIKQAFDFEAGLDEKAKPPLAVYKPNDNEDFIK